MDAQDAESGRPHLPRGRTDIASSRVTKFRSRSGLARSDIFVLALLNTLFMDVLNQLFERHFHAPATRVQPLQGQLGGSGRNILRLANDRFSAIGILYSVREENVAFLEFSRHFRRHGLPVPEIYAEDLSHGAYLEEDLGDTTLFEFLSRNRAGDVIAPEAMEAYRNVVALLPRFQVEAGRD